MRLAVLVPLIRALALGPVQVLMFERTVSLTLLAFLMSVCWKAGWPKVLGNLRKDAIFILGGRQYLVP